MDLDEYDKFTLIRRPSIHDLPEDIKYKIYETLNYKDREKLSIFFGMEHTDYLKGLRKRNTVLVLDDRYNNISTNIDTQIRRNGSEVVITSSKPFQLKSYPIKKVKRWGNMILDRRLINSKTDLTEVEDIPYLGDTTSLSQLFFNYKGTKINNIEFWDVSRITDMYEMFFRCDKLTMDLSRWNVSSLEDASEMFLGCDKFNSDLSKWDVSNLIEANEMFYGCSMFDSDLSKWNTSNLKNSRDMFYGCDSLSRLPKFNI